jgi:hypothetical protein
MIVDSKATMGAFAESALATSDEVRKFMRDSFSQSQISRGRSPYDLADISLPRSGMLAR